MNIYPIDCVHYALYDCSSNPGYFRVSHGNGRIIVFLKVLEEIV
jgi:hypothetical protein